MASANREEPGASGLSVGNSSASTLPVASSSRDLRRWWFQRG